jgi:hypothetical protein
LFHEMWHNDDELSYRVAQQVLEGRYTFVERGVMDPSGDGPMIGEPDEEADKDNVWRRVTGDGQIEATDPGELIEAAEDDDGTRAGPGRAEGEPAVADAGEEAEEPSDEEVETSA